MLLPILATYAFLPVPSRYPAHSTREMEADITYDMNF
jgi:hypothetical protein